MKNSKNNPSKNSDKKIRSKASPKKHDHIFKKSMSRINVAREFFEFKLPTEIKSKVDLSTLEVQNASFIDSTLGEGTVDMLYKVDFDGKPGYLYTLCEHQSTPDKYMTLRMQKYMLRILDHHKDHHKDDLLPVIFPMIVYSGKDKYTAPKEMWELFGDPALAKACFTKAPMLIDISKLSDKELKEHPFSGLLLYFLHKIYQDDILSYIKEFAGIIDFISKNDFNYLTDLVIYIIEKGESPKDQEIISTFHKLVDNKNKEQVMTIAERIEARGIQIGLERGLEQGLEQGSLLSRKEIARAMISQNIDLNLIAQITKLPLSEVKKLQQPISD